MRAKKKPRRSAASETDALVRELEELAALAPGGAPERAIPVDTPAVIDMRAIAQPCPLCEGSMKLEEHAADEIDGIRLRVAAVACTSCGVRRKRYFRLAAPTVH